MKKGRKNNNYVGRTMTSRKFKLGLADQGTLCYSVRQIRLKILPHVGATTPNHTCTGVREVPKESKVKDKGVMTSNVLQEDPCRQSLNSVTVRRLDPCGGRQYTTCTTIVDFKCFLFFYSSDTSDRSNDRFEIVSAENPYFINIF